MPDQMEFFEDVARTSWVMGAWPDLEKALSGLGSSFVA